LNELNTKKFSHDCVEKLDVKCGGGGAEKFDGGLTGLSTTSTPRKSAKFDGAGV